jgi:hypothetical protein
MVRAADRRPAQGGDVGCGSDSAVGATLAARPLYPRKLTTLLQRPSRQPRARHKVAALQRASRGQEPKGLQPVERAAVVGWQG